MIWCHDAEKMKQFSIANGTKIVYDLAVMILILARMLPGSLMPATQPA